MPSAELRSSAGLGEWLEGVALQLLAAAALLQGRKLHGIAGPTAGFQSPVLEASSPGPGPRDPEIGDVGREAGGSGRLRIVLTTEPGTIQIGFSKSVRISKQIVRLAMYLFADRKRGRVRRAEDVYEAVWNEEYEGEIKLKKNRVQQGIRALRRALNDVHKRVVRTHKGDGYAGYYVDRDIDIEIITPASQSGSPAP
ncbi:MAG: helix-turn-helix domain-containing protein [Candidatus Aenigmarchaeota archaeon]|nr:helix-turn-helix domain-containing protein [Candidatus Aenigmarchaeota archaeon]